MTATRLTFPLSKLTQSGATSNQVPQWNGTEWVPATISVDLSSYATTSAVAAGYVPRITSVDNRLPRFDGVTGAIQSSGITVDDSNNITGVGTLATSGDITTDGTASLLNVGVRAGGIAVGRGASSVTGEQIALFNNSTNVFALTGSTRTMQLGSTLLLAFSGTTTSTATKDTSLGRASAGVLQIGDGAANALGSLNLTNCTATGRFIGAHDGTVGATTPASGSFTAITESANAATGTGGLVRSTSPTLVTPALGTPSALVVTNATGTASININGTVGATTPTTVAATTITASGLTTLQTANTLQLALRTTTTGNGALYLMQMLDAAGTVHGQWYGEPATRKLTIGNLSSLSTASTVLLAGGADRLTVFQSGRVAIGPTADDGTNRLQINGSVRFTTVGIGNSYTAGTGQRAGNATLVAGTVTVTNTSITANSVIILCVKTIGGTVGTLSYTLSAGASFTINSSNIADTSVVSYLIQEVV